MEFWREATYDALGMGAEAYAGAGAGFLAPPPHPKKVWEAGVADRVPPLTREKFPHTARVGGSGRCHGLPADRNGHSSTPAGRSFPRSVPCPSGPLAARQRAAPWACCW